MYETNHAHATDRNHWHELNANAPEIPDAPAPNPDDIDWAELGEYDWHYTVATGHFGDDEPEVDRARDQRDRIRAHLEHMDADQLRDYLNGLHTGTDMFMMFGL